MATAPWPCRRRPAAGRSSAAAGGSRRLPLHRGGVQPGAPRSESAAGPGVLAGPARAVRRRHVAARVALRHGPVPGPLSRGGDGACRPHGAGCRREMVPRGLLLVAHRAAEGPLRLGLLRRLAGLCQAQRHLRLRHRRLLDALDQALHGRGHRRLRGLSAKARRAVQQRHPAVGDLERAQHLLLAGPRELYATLLAKSYAAIKETDPAGPGAGPLDGRDRLQLHRADAGPEAPFDVLTIHPYRRTSTTGRSSAT